MFALVGCRTSWLLKTVVGRGSPCLLVGQSGTSKSVTINSFLAGLDATSHIMLNMNFSSRTSSSDVQRAIDDSTEKRTKVCLKAATELQINSITPKQHQDTAQCS
jgi:ABC-type dipeptide/oligopeptide/nickel transport system ATPase component